jgi:hypothetical protein
MKAPRVEEAKCKKIQSVREPCSKAGGKKFKAILKFHEIDNNFQVLIYEYLHSWVNAVQLKIWILCGKMKILVMH